MLKVTDEDDARHPHGMHTYAFMVDGEADSRFEVDMDGNLKLKDGESLNHEDDDEFVLKVTATDMAVGDDDSDTASVSLEITVTVKNVAAADRPVANKKIGDWWVTVDDDLEADDVRDGDWLSFRLDTTGDDAAFSHEDGDDLTYSVSVVDGDGNVVDWLQISDTGMMTNKADMLPEAGVYMVTVTATDEDNDSAQTTFELAVALSDEGDRDNDTPDIRDVEEFDYEENSGAQKVASFSVRDDDVAIAPHPYGVLTVTWTATQEDDDDNTMNVANRFKIVEVGRNEDSVHYEIWTKSAAELAVDDMGKALPAARVPKPLDFENGDEVDITVTVTDGREEMDDKVITIDLDNDADEAPVFQPSAVDGGSGGLRSMKTTTVTVDQEATKEVIVVQLSEAWEDSDTDDDELDFSISGKGGLPDWVTVYGPDNWEDIYERQRDVDRGDGPSDVRDRDIVFAIVIDRSGAGDGDNESLMSAEFMVTARDNDGNSATEKIVIAVDDVNVDIATDDDDDVVDITGNLAGRAPLTMDVDLSLDPDLDGAGDATLVVYTWSHDNATPTDTADDRDPMVSSTPQPFALLNTATPPVRVPDGAIITAKVQYYEIDPKTHQIIESKEYTDTATVAALPPAGTTSAGATFEVTTTTTGVSAVITATGPASSASGQAQLQVSTNGTSGWLNASVAVAADTSGGPATAALLVDEDRDGTGGDGGGLYYRVVYSYIPTGQTQRQELPAYDIGQLGNLADDDPFSGSGATTDIIGGSPTTDNPDVGETLRINTGGNDSDVQWQYRDPTATAPMWKDISGATSLTLRVTSDLTGKELRAKVTYKTDDNTATPNVDESEWADWIEYTEVLTVAGGDATNDVPVATGEDNEMEVELAAVRGMNQPTKVMTFDASALFHDPDGDDLMYTITGVTPDVDLDAATVTPAGTAAAPAAGRDAELEGDVWRVHKTENDGTTTTTTDDLQQSISINPSTGEITYFTDLSHGHDGTGGEANDGTGNALTVALSVTDGDANTTAITDQTVVVRINVAPTAIELTGTDSSGTAGGININNAAGNLSKMKATPTALTNPDDTNDIDPATDGVQGDTDTDNDLYTIAENVQNQPAINLATLDVQDENLNTHKFGTHSWKVSDDRFAVVRDADTDGSTWILQLKQGASFNYEADGDKKGTLVVTITATDGGGLSTTAHFSVKISDVAEEAPPTTPTTPPADPEVPGLEDDADDSDDDGPVIPPDDGSMFIDDLLDQFVISIDDIDVA